MKFEKIVLVFTTILLVILEIYAIFQNNFKYIADFFALIISLWGVYIFRDKLRIHAFHYFLLATFLIIHYLGVFGAYEWVFLGIEYDIYVHFYFGIIIGLMTFRAYNHYAPKEFKGVIGVVLMLFLILGFGAFHELIEFGGARLMGQGEGLFLYGAGDIDEWDTQKDLLMGLFGAMISISGYLIYRRKI